MNVPCNDKERLVYESIRRLIAEGADPASLRASDIAQAAGVGKGTLYLYFDSKEEMVLKTLLYVLQTQIEQVVQSMDAAEGFEPKCRAALASIRAWSQRKDSAFRLLFAAHSSINLQQACQLAAGQMEERLQSIHNLTRELYDLGVREGAIAADLGFAYARHVFVSAVAGLHHMLTLPELAPSAVEAAGLLGGGTDSGEAAEEHAWHMLQRALA